MSHSGVLALIFSFFGWTLSPEALLHQFGYLAVFIGTFLEGETILVMAGFFAERG